MALEVYNASDLLDIVGPVDVIVGLQRGDEAKGCTTDLYAGLYDIIARGNGGANAGHSILVDNGKPDEKIELALHQIPSGIAYQGKMNVIGNGVFVDAVRLRKEMEDAESAGITLTPDKLAVSSIAHLVFPHHILLDELRESSGNAQGSTKVGIAYASAEKHVRENKRVENIFVPTAELLDLAYEGLYKVTENADTKMTKERQEELRDKARQWAKSLELLKPFVTDTVELLKTATDDGQTVLAEGAQGFWLDVNHGMYPAVTSSSVTTNGLIDGLGFSHKHVGRVTGVAKLTKSHVGGGPFVTEIHDPELAERLRGKPGEIDSEYGTTTGRPRRVGYFDFPELRSAIHTNGVDQLVVSKMDCADRFDPEPMQYATSYDIKDETGTKTEKDAPRSELDLNKSTANYKTAPTWSGDISKVRDYHDAPQECKAFVEDVIEKELDVAVKMLGVGPDREEVIVR